MSENMCTAPGIFKGAQFDDDEKEEKTVDIYVSGDSLTVYENPWVEGIQPPNTPNTARNQLPVPAVPVHPEKRNPFRAAAVFLGLLSLFLLAGLIAIGVKSSKNQNNWDIERNQLVLEKYELLDRLCEEGCPDDWERLHCSCYFVTGGKKNWEDSRLACENREAHLVIISSKEEQEFVKKVLPGNKGKAWIGLSRKDNEDVWKWVDGATLKRNPPWDDSKSPNSPEDCILMDKSNDRVFNWKTEKCKKKYSWICEKEIH